MPNANSRSASDRLPERPRSRSLCRCAARFIGAGTLGIASQRGPVQRERGFLVHRRPEVGDSVQLEDDVYLSVSTDALRALLAGDPAAYRLCLGYAGWGPGQLEREMVAGGWLNSSITSRRIFDTPVEKIWDAVIRDLGIDPAFLVQGGGKQ